MLFIVEKIEDWQKLVALIRKQYPSIRIFLLKGDLGAGKTTFVQTFCKTLGIVDKVSSPTFSIVQEYRSTGIKPTVVYHIDLYRLDHLEELEQIGFWEYLDQNGTWVFIEWPELIQNTIEDAKILEIEVMEDESRKILIL